MRNSTLSNPDSATRTPGRKPVASHHDPALPRRSRERTEIRKRSFNRIAVLYDRARPGYPARLFADLVHRSGIPEHGRILEIGPGTGQATLPLAWMGYRILAIELGDRLADLLRTKCRRLPNVEVINLPFEDWSPEPAAFDLAMAATSFHWIPPQIAFRRCAQVLKPSGSLALLWNFRATPDTEFFRALEEVYRRFTPAMSATRAPDERIERQRKKIVSSGLFGPVTVCRYPWERAYTAEEYIALLETQSDHTIPDPAPRHRLFRAIRQLINRLGGRVVRPSVAVLFLARKRAEV